MYEAELNTHMFLSFSHVRKKTKYQRRNSLLEDLVFLRKDALFSSFPRKLPIFLILLSKTLYFRDVCAKFSRSVVSESWWPKQPTALHWFTCGTTHPFIFPDKLPIFLSRVSFFLNQCKGAWKRGRSYVYLLICWLVYYLVCYVITTRENYNPSL